MAKNANAGKCGGSRLMNRNNLFDFAGKIIPGLRRDIELIPVRNNGKSLIYFHDNLGYMPDHFALDDSVAPLLSFFTGHYSFEQMLQQVNHTLNREHVLDFIHLLDKNLVLDSDYYKTESQKTDQMFEKQTVRQPVLAGKSYPDTPGELRTYLDSLFIKSESTTTHSPENYKALYAPHIDISVGEKQYAEAFSAIRHLQPKTVIILGTSHYAGYYADLYDEFPFIGSTKNFTIPGTTFQTDNDFLKKLASQGESVGFTLRDRAHRIEHSIETHLLFLSKIWTHPYTIVPILVGGFDEILYHQSGNMAAKITNFTNQLKALSDEHTFVLISGDLSHVGKKFGDQHTATTLRNSTERFDTGFVDIASAGNPGNLLQHISKGYDETRVCGFPPLYTFLKMFPGISGERLNYHWWDETATESAVSFGSLIYK